MKHELNSQDCPIIIVRRKQNKNCKPNPVNTESQQYFGENAMLSSVLSGNLVVKIAKATASSSATLDFTNLTGYTSFLFNLANVLPATDNVRLWIRLSTDNGSSWDSGTNYTSVFLGANSLGGSDTVAGQSITQIIVAGGTTNGLSNGSSRGVTGRLLFASMGSGSVEAGCIWSIQQVDTVPEVNVQMGAGLYSTIAAINGVRFLMSSGNIASGTITVYGVI